MRKFILKIISFSTILILLILTSLAVFNYKIDNIKIDDSITILISGDSHTQSGIDDSFLKNSLNISHSSQHFLYTFNVLKLLLNNNQNIKKVILGVSFHSLSAFYDDYIHSKNETKVMFSNYFAILDMESLLDINKIPLKQSADIYKNIIKSLVFTSTINEYSFIGGFYQSIISNLNDSTVISAIKRHFYTKSGKVQEFSYYQVKYLTKIVEFCDEKNIELILINTPIHERYYKKIPKKFLSNYYLVIQKFSGKILFLDFHSIKFEQNSYGDGDHLNLIGAKRLSYMIDDILTNKIRP